MAWTSLPRILVSTLALSLGGLPLQAQDLPKKPDLKPTPVPSQGARTWVSPLDMDETTYVVGNTLLILYHELAHALVDAGGLPSLGQEEDAADDFALVELVVRLQAAANDSAEQAKFRAYGFAFVDLWLKSALETGVPTAGDYFDQHALDLQRHFNSACVLYGGSTHLFGELTKVFELDDEAMRERCRDRYFAAYDGWSYTLDTFGLLQTPAAAQHPDLLIEFAPAKRSQHSRWQALAEEADEFRQLQEHFSQTYALGQPLRIVFESCDTENAFYYPRLKKISLCYELMNAFSRHHQRDTQAALRFRP